MMFCASCPPLTHRLLPEEGGGTTLTYSQPLATYSPCPLAPLAPHPSGKFKEETLFYVFYSMPQVGGLGTRFEWRET